MAARTYAILTDRMQGSKSVSLMPTAEAVGSVDNVSHEIGSDGATRTLIELPGNLPPIDLFSLLPESTRRIVLRLAPSPGKAPV